MLSSFECCRPHSFPHVNPAHLQGYLKESCCRINRRDRREYMFRRLLDRGVPYGTQAPYSLLTAT